MDGWTQKSESVRAGALVVTVVISITAVALIGGLALTSAGCCEQTRCASPRTAAAARPQPPPRPREAPPRREAPRVTKAGSDKPLTLLQAARVVCRGSVKELRQALSRKIQSQSRVVMRIVRRTLKHRREHGPCLKVVQEGKNRLRFIHKRSSLMSRLYLSDRGRIGGLWFDIVLPNKDSLAAIEKELRALGGDVAITVRRPAGKPLLRLNGDKPLAVASSFKLSVLKAIVSQIKTRRLRWSTTIRWKGGDYLRPHFPAGFFPKGAWWTLESLASFMIMFSDNAATDGLISRLGRALVERHAPKRNRPLLTTSEMTKLKSKKYESFAKQYIAAKSVAARRKILKTLAAKALPKAWGDKPRYIHELEWFYTTDELCSLALELRRVRLFKAVGKLKRHPPVWDRYVFKGGSEPGVRNLTFALRHKKHQGWYCISVTWNNPRKAVKGAKLMRLAKRLMRLLSKLPKK